MMMKALRTLRLLQARRAPSCCSMLESRRTIDDSATDEEFHFLPVGKSDVSMQSRVTFIDKEMTEDFRIGIRTISQQGFRLIDKNFMFGPIAVFPKTVLSWRVATAADITPESLELFFMMQPSLQILILGVGERKNVDGVRHRVAKAISDHRIGFEIMPTIEAVATFNFLNAEHREVAAALFPPEEMVTTDHDAGRIYDWIGGGGDKMPIGPFQMGIVNTSLDPVTDICRKIWGTTEEAERMEKDIRELRALRKEEKTKYFAKRRAEKEALQLEEEKKAKEAKVAVGAAAEEQKKVDGGGGGDN